MTTSGPRPACRGADSSRVSPRLLRPTNKDAKKWPRFMHSRYMSMETVCFNIYLCKQHFYLSAKHFLWFILGCFVDLA